MGFNANMVQVAGRIGQEIELKYTASGTAVVNFSVATNRFTKNKDGNGYDTVVTWLDIAAFGKTAERVSEYGGKGVDVYVPRGRIDVRKWEDKEGHKRTSYSVIADEVQLGRNAGAASTAKPQSEPKPKSEPKPNEAPVPTSSDEEQDDLPF